MLPAGHTCHLLNADFSSRMAEDHRPPLLIRRDRRSILQALSPTQGEIKNLHILISVTLVIPERLGFQKSTAGFKEAREYLRQALRHSRSALKILTAPWSWTICPPDDLPESGAGEGGGQLLIRPYEAFRCSDGDEVTRRDCVSAQIATHL